MTLVEGKSAIHCFVLDDETDASVISVVSSNPLAASAEIEKVVNLKYLFVRITANGEGFTTVSLEGSGLEGDEKESIRAEVRRSEIYTAEFRCGTATELAFGENRTEILNVYASGIVRETDLKISVDNSAVAEVYFTGSSQREYSTELYFNISALSVGNAVISVTDADGRELAPLLGITVSEKTQLPVSEDTNATDNGNEAASADGNGEISYILNIKSKKFHKPTCRGANDIKDANKGTFTGTREGILAQGYTPCGICKP